MRRDDSDPLRLVVLGDFSGKSPAERPPLASRLALGIDVDTVDAVIKRLTPRVNGSFGTIDVEQLDDFHPDRLYARLPLFKALRETRATPPTQRDTDDLLGRLIGTPAEPRAAAPGAAPPGGLDAFIRSIVAPHIVPDTAASTAAYVAAVDAAIADQMRAVLHDRSFQALEASWRGVQWLVSNLELDEALQLRLFDMTREELAAGPAAIERTLSKAGLDGTILVALFQFGPSEQDARLLAELAAVASRTGGLLLGGFDEASGGDEAAASAGWQALRRSDAAKRIGLAAPRVLLRRPYGPRTDPIDTFAFEEVPGVPEHEHLLWGTASLATALLIGRSFRAGGWNMEPGDEREIGDMPAFTFERDGETELQACAERYLTESDIRALLSSGLIPIASRRDTNGIVAIRFQSIAEPAAGLAW